MPEILLTWLRTVNRQPWFPRGRLVKTMSRNQQTNENDVQEKNKTMTNTTTTTAHKQKQKFMKTRINTIVHAHLFNAKSILSMPNAQSIIYVEK